MMNRSPWKTNLAIALFLLVAGSIFARANTAPTTTRAQAIAIVRSIISQNATPCHINKTNSITAVAAGSKWRVTAKVVMAASGTARTETLVWVVATEQAVPASQIASEVSSGCP
jgi:hypothetical protein